MNGLSSIKTKRKLVLTLFWACFSFFTLIGNTLPLNKLYHRLSPTAVDSIFQHYLTKMDSVSTFYANYIHQEQPFESYDVPLKRAYYRFFVPMTFYSEVIKDRFDPNWKPVQLADSTAKSVLHKTLNLDLPNLQEAKQIGLYVNKTIFALYLKSPKLVKYQEQQIASKKVFKESLKHQPVGGSFAELFKPEPVVQEKMESSLIIHKPNFWYTYGEGSMQFTQNYISSNWYKGGQSDHSILSNLKLAANYNDQQKVQFDNLLEVKIGLNSVPSDTLRTYRVNTDMLRITSKLGLQATKHWYYTVSGEINTQFFVNYKTNTNQKVSAFLAPANFILSVGMDYKLKQQKIDLSVFIAPVTYALRYVNRKGIDETTFGLKKGEKTLQDYGSRLTTNMRWTIIPAVIWNSRLSYFTNYKKSEAEWENTFDFVLNRYFSTKLFVHLRHDDGVNRKPGVSYLQIKELLSFGFNYRW